MNPKVKRKWLKALRSGEYKQGKGMLCIDPVGEEGRKDGDFGFCCLGVLTNLYYLEMGESFPEHEWENGGLSMSVQRWADLAYQYDEYHQSGKKADQSTMDTLPALDLLAEWNDSGKRFTTIANWIEREL